MKVKTGIFAGAPVESNGLGDTLAHFTQVTGLDRLAQAYEQATGKSCGCETRREKLNRLFPYA